MDKDLQEQLENQALEALECHGMESALDVFYTAFTVVKSLADKETDTERKSDLIRMALNCMGLSQNFHSEHRNKSNKTA